MKAFPDQHGNPSSRTQAPAILHLGIDHIWMIHGVALPQRSLSITLQRAFAAFSMFEVKALQE